MASPPSLNGLTTAHLADACLRVGAPLRVGPPELRPLEAGMQVSGPARPVRHFGSVDVFLEAIEAAAPGEVLVVDNGRRTDEACIGDLIAHEAQLAGLAGLVVWGLHRDTTEIGALGVPLFSLGATPAGPQRLDARDEATFRSARVGDVVVHAGDVVHGDADGLVVVGAADAAVVVAAAESIRAAEHRQAAAMADGRSLRLQLGFADYLRRAAADPHYTLRRHLEEHGGAVEV